MNLILHVFNYVFIGINIYYKSYKQLAGLFWLFLAFLALSIPGDPLHVKIEVISVISAIKKYTTIKSLCPKEAVREGEKLS